ncbi:16S rRNA (guanine(966)-N(2))-methyltransferase RsmD [Candidatus Pelagibacter sp. HIMB1509]|uniref:16S rRNA (guanine(966)-N(2))-methyltransferase RsmD n=1 Tax=Candidatus Pelagibacter sp. HIMB1509 TaxID=3413339 RepID=UPI003F858973
MRIISGEFKGKKLLEPKDLNTRPLKDLTKESIFNILNHSNKFKILTNRPIILDIFSGIGSFGLECLSRGADRVIFIENYKQVLSILKKNLSNLKSIDNYSVIEKDAYDRKTIGKLNYRFDVIFLDPPYKDKNIDTILKNIETEKLLNENGIIILHRHKNSNDMFPSNFKIIEEKTYGISKIIFLKY